MTSFMRNRMKTTLLTFLTMFLKTLIIFFTPIKGIVVLIMLSVVIDTAFGIWKVKVLNDPDDPFNSRKMRFGFVRKTVVYLLFIGLVFITDVFILNDLVKYILSNLEINYLCTRIGALILIGIEMKSMDESWFKVKGWSFIERAGGILRRIKKAKEDIQS